ncbi:MAG: hypothetical protein K1Y02_19040 [Candidatus Hydrogenedentes bacterium]|nr:hypothetical protein [Candidatus Hydrogenedentota bacterium]
MGDFDLASLIYLLQSLQPIFGGIGSIFGALFQFLFLGFDLGTFFLGFI